MSIYESQEINGLDEIVSAGMIMIDNAVEKVIMKHEFEIEMIDDRDRRKEQERLVQQSRYEFDAYRRQLEVLDAI